MTLRQWGKFVFLLCAIGGFTILFYQTLSCYAHPDFPAHRKSGFDLIFVQANAAEPEQQDDARQFIRSMGDDVISAISDGTLSKEQKKEKLADVLNRNFDMNTINRFTMGRYWRKMTPTQQQEYAVLYKELIVSIYADKFANYQGETLTIGNAIGTDTHDFIVQSHIIRPNSKNIPVDWHVRFKNNEHKIIDVAIENVSMIITQRADFASTIQRKGGNPAVILDFLRNRLGHQTQ